MDRKVLAGAAVLGVAALVGAAVVVPPDTPTAVSPIVEQAATIDASDFDPLYLEEIILIDTEWCEVSPNNPGIYIAHFYAENTTNDRLEGIKVMVALQDRNEGDKLIAEQRVEIYIGAGERQPIRVPFETEPIGFPDVDVWFGWHE